MITVENLRKSYDSQNHQTQAIKDVSFTIEKGEFVSIVGPSGCGKTTLLKICAGIYKQTDGIIEQINKRTSMIFQQPILLEWKTLKENVLLPIDIQNRKAASYRKIIKITKLQEFENHYPRQLSGGMKQRAALARALITKPTMIFMDEPFSALDELLREELNEELLVIWRKLKPTILFVTHSLQEAVYLSDKIIILSKAPAKVKTCVQVDLPRPRVREQAAFQEKVQWIKNQIE